ncbi:MAG: 1,4-dihydroxy-2-naphthoate octaprenyltransferase [Bacteroidales bacterium]
MKLKAWMQAARPRTLPLAFSSALMGSFAALNEGKFSGLILTLALVTTLFLQVLSNFANDYGDAISGLDHKNRVGPARAVQSGAISPSAMKTAMVVSSLGALISGLWLIYEGFENLVSPIALLFLLLGLGAIASAIRYTVGRRPYGYYGLGDLFVFLFFGIVGVTGTFFLHTHQLPPQIIWPTLMVGLLSVAVLNVNNMRDMQSDAAAGKRSIAVRLGFKRSKTYHTLLVGSALVSLLIYIVNYMKDTLSLLPLAFALPWFGLHLARVWKTQENPHLDPELKKVALGTFVTTLLIGLAIAMS